MEEDYQPQLQQLLSSPSASRFTPSFESGANDEDDDDSCMIIGVCEEILWQRVGGPNGGTGVSPSTRDPNMSAPYQTKFTQKI